MLSSPSIQKASKVKVGIIPTNKRLTIVSNSELLPQSVKLLDTRSAAWFSNDRCPMVRYRQNYNSAEVARVKSMIIGFEDIGVVAHKVFMNGSDNLTKTYAVAPTDTKVYYLEYPTDFEKYGDDVPGVLWIYNRPDFRVKSGKVTKSEFLECLHLFKLAGIAEQQVGLSSIGKPKNNEEVYTSFAMYKKWLRKQNVSSKSVEIKTDNNNNDNDDKIGSYKNAVYDDDANDDDNFDEDSEGLDGVLSDEDLGITKTIMSITSAILSLLGVLLLIFFKVRARIINRRQNYNSLKDRLTHNQEHDLDLIDIEAASPRKLTFNSPIIKPTNVTTSQNKNNFSYNTRLYESKNDLSEGIYEDMEGLKDLLMNHKQPESNNGDMDKNKNVIATNKPSDVGVSNTRVSIVHQPLPKIPEEPPYDKLKKPRPTTVYLNELKDLESKLI